MLKGALWLILYLQAIALPLWVGLLWPGEAADRPVSSQLTSALGYCGLTIVLLELALISKIAWISGLFGQDALLRFHRRMGLIGVALIVLHAGLALLGGYPWSWLNPLNPESPGAMRWGVVSTLALLLLVALSLVRRAVRLSYEAWELTHGALADAALAAAFLHAFVFGSYAQQRPMAMVLTVYAVGAVAMRVWFRFVRPARLWSKPWEVVRNTVERGASRTLVLKPVGHGGFAFEPGQFAWLSTGRTPFHWDRHPISMSSAAPDEAGHEIGFTIKDLGDWSGQVVPRLTPGQRVWVDGPHGVFTPDRQQGAGYVLIAGGSGIGPLFSMVRTLAERGDARPVVLFFASRGPEGLTFREELDRLTLNRPLRVVYVVEHAPPDWSGERGQITAELLRRHLPAKLARWQFFVCGPEAMMDAVEDALAELGVRGDHVHTERFVMV
ncbi:MAG: ferric reductase-like transmembrane domain-containing protein [Bryobacterales bacterium]|nr:ferric reductase-like transmembrane domain-containing protein [Bryobacterales bacterium]